MSVTQPRSAVESPSPETDCRFRLNDDVFSFEQNGIVRLLNFRRGHFFGLDRLGSEMFLSLRASGFAATVQEMAQVYDADERQVAADLRELLDQLTEKRLIRPRRNDVRKNPRADATRLAIFPLITHYSLLITGKTRRLFGFGSRNAASDVAPQIPTAKSVGKLLTLAWISLRLFGWTGTLQLWRRWHRLLKPPESIDENLLKQVDNLVREAATRKVFPSVACKERAIVGYQILRGFLGLPAELVLGIQPNPFGAHAWVECGGRVITDFADHCAMYTPVARYGEIDLK